jgi:LysM repeat protein
VYKGQRLGSIAKRYNVSVGAVCTANGITRSSAIHPGDVLLIPGRGDDDGSYAASLREKGQVGNKTKARRSSPQRSSKAKSRTSQTWRKYKKPAWRRGYINIVGFNASWKGYVIDAKGRVIPNALHKISKVLSATGKRPRINARLIQLIAKVSDTFGGRPMRVVSGYRERSFAAASRHRTGRALDFSIPGVPNEALRDYLRTFDNVGVGYYPNSTFIHLDVREADTYWIDYSGPGEPPRKAPTTRATPGASEEEHHEHDGSGQ